MIVSWERDYRARLCHDQGVARALEGRLEEAIAWFRQALEWHPDFAEAHYSLGRSAFDLERLDDAVAHFREAIRSAPDYVEAHYNLAHVLLLKGDWEAAWPEYEWRWLREGAARFPYPMPRWGGSARSG